METLDPFAGMAETQVAMDAAAPGSFGDWDT
jgi:hypothetical protein